MAINATWKPHEVHGERDLAFANIKKVALHWRRQSSVGV
jgi:hypothetical protein